MLRIGKSPCDHPLCSECWFLLLSVGQGCKDLNWRSCYENFQTRVYGCTGGFPVGSKCDALVSSVDFAPTILDLAGIYYSKEIFEGESFLPWLTGKKQPQGRTLYLELGYARGIIHGKWKYLALSYPPTVANMTFDERKKILDSWNANRIRKHMETVTTDPNAGFSHLTAIPGGAHAESKSTGREYYPGYYDLDQLYDISRDPHEQKNLANDPEYRQKLKQMREELRDIISTLPGKFEV